MSNAIKFTDQKGSININIHETKREKNIVTLKFSVNDTGCGISQDKIPQLFIPYKQLPQKCMSEGTGLGLTIVKSIVELHGGNVGVISIEEKGAEFYFTIPLPIKSLDIPTNVEIEISPIEEKKHTCVRVLIVEDDELSRTIMSHVLTKKGMMCDDVVNGEEAVNALKQTPNKWNVILMDKTMPKLSGVKATKQIREMGLTVPIIAMTGNALMSERKGFLNAGANAWLIKPVEIPQLVSTIYRLV